MNQLINKILADAIILPNEIIKVDSFLNHQIDSELFKWMGQAIHRHYQAIPITKIVTCEASGIALALACAYEFSCPVVFARKEASLLTKHDSYQAAVYSYTKQKETLFTISKRFLTENDRILIVDDFLANGQAMLGLINICQQANAQIDGLAVAIEKGFQMGGKLLREKYPLYSLAIIDSIEDGKLTFRVDE